MDEKESTEKEQNVDGLHTGGEIEIVKETGGRRMMPGRGEQTGPKLLQQDSEKIARLEDAGGAASSFSVVNTPVAAGAVCTTVGNKLHTTTNAAGATTTPRGSCKSAEERKKYSVDHLLLDMSSTRTHGYSHVDGPPKTKNPAAAASSTSSPKGDSYKNVDQSQATSVRNSRKQDRTPARRGGVTRNGQFFCGGTIPATPCVTSRRGDGRQNSGAFFPTTTSNHDHKAGNLVKTTNQTAESTTTCSRNKAAAEVVPGAAANARNKKYTTTGFQQHRGRNEHQQNHRNYSCAAPSISSRRLRSRSREHHRGRDYRPSRGAPARSEVRSRLSRYSRSNCRQGNYGFRRDSRSRLGAKHDDRRMTGHVSTSNRNGYQSQRSRGEGPRAAAASVSRSCNYFRSGQNYFRNRAQSHATSFCNTRSASVAPQSGSRRTNQNRHSRGSRPHRDNCHASVYGAGAALAGAGGKDGRRSMRTTGYPTQRRAASISSKNTKQSHHDLRREQGKILHGMNMSRPPRDRSCRQYVDARRSRSPPRCREQPGSVRAAPHSQNKNRNSSRGRAKMKEPSAAHPVAEAEERKLDEPGEINESRRSKSRMIARQAQQATSSVHSKMKRPPATYLKDQDEQHFANEQKHDHEGPGNTSTTAAEPRTAAGITVTGDDHGTGEAVVATASGPVDGGVEARRPLGSTSAARHGKTSTPQLFVVETNINLQGPAASTTSAAEKFKIHWNANNGADEEGSSSSSSSSSSSEDEDHENKKEKTVPVRLRDNLGRSRETRNAQRRGVAGGLLQRGDGRAAPSPARAARRGESTAQGKNFLEKASPTPHASDVFGTSLPSRVAGTAHDRVVEPRQRREPRQSTLRTNAAPSSRITTNDQGVVYQQNKGPPREDHAQKKSPLRGSCRQNDRNIRSPSRVRTNYSKAPAEYLAGGGGGGRVGISKLGGQRDRPLPYEKVSPASPRHQTPGVLVRRLQSVRRGRSRSRGGLLQRGGRGCPASPRHQTPGLLRRKLVSLSRGRSRGREGSSRREDPHAGADEQERKRNSVHLNHGSRQSRAPSRAPAKGKGGPRRRATRGGAPMGPIRRFELDQELQESDPPEERKPRDADLSLGRGRSIGRGKQVEVSAYDASTPRSRKRARSRQSQDHIKDAENKATIVGDDVSPRREKEKNPHSEIDTAGKKGGALVGLGGNKRQRLAESGDDRSKSPGKQGASLPLKKNKAPTRAPQRPSASSSSSSSSGGDDSSSSGSCQGSRSSSSEDERPPKAPQTRKKKVVEEQPVNIAKESSKSNQSRSRSRKQKGSKGAVGQQAEPKAARSGVAVKEQEEMTGPLQQQHLLPNSQQPHFLHQQPQPHYLMQVLVPAPAANAAAAAAQSGGVHYALPVQPVSAPPALQQSQSDSAGGAPASFLVTTGHAAPGGPPGAPGASSTAAIHQTTQQPAHAQWTTSNGPPTMHERSANSASSTSRCAPQAASSTSGQSRNMVGTSTGAGSTRSGGSKARRASAGSSRQNVSYHNAMSDPVTQNCIARFGKYALAHRTVVDKSFMLLFLQNPELHEPFFQKLQAESPEDQIKTSPADPQRFDLSTFYRELWIELLASRQKQQMAQRQRFQQQA
ncbi:unnamed protein product [Amoebophrya sp. A120]|nr:unnamed protein product [Amoebophrya sp. A120]|eukprot:GSA120T00001403001.1